MKSDAKIDERELDMLSRSSMRRRTFITAAAAGTVVAIVGGSVYVMAGEEETRRARETQRTDGRSRLPPGQYLIKQLRPMGGAEGDPSPGAFRLRVHGSVEQPFEIDFAELLRMPQVDQTCDVHCVTKWSMLDAQWNGVRLSDLAARARVKSKTRTVIFEAAHGYTSNVPLREAMKPNVLIAHRHGQKPLLRPHGAPVRALVPDLYFWKSAKWLTGIRFSEVDQPGYWEVRGYNNNADPWKEERYS